MRIANIAWLALLLTGLAHGSTIDEIAALQKNAGVNRAQSASTALAPRPAAAPRWFTLSNGARVNLNDWKVVLFMQGHCPYCHQFDPLLKSLSERVGFSVFAYTFDGQGDATFPEAIPAPPEVMRTFFPGLPVASPTTFLVNVNTLATYPMIQGASDERGFMARLDTVLQEATLRGDHRE
ncbi:type-F conjugative transfer system pilin assembly thiol-disulfide isomerase TrbB [Serratia sp. IR-2025]